MAAVLLGWNPGTRHWNGLYASAVAEVQNSGGYLEQWSFDNGMNLPAGTEVWLLVQDARPKRQGLIGHGVAVGEMSAVQPANPDISASSTYVNIQFDFLLPDGEQLRINELVVHIPEIDWNAEFSSFWRIPPDTETAIREVWAAHLLDGAFRNTDTVDPVPGSYPEPALQRVPVNRYERIPEAKAVAIAHLGSSCHACGFDFEATYGTPGADFSHVHHTVPAARLGPGYEIDPIVDLVPLCPNCHYMAHRRAPTPYTVAELRTMIAAAGHLPGIVVTAEQQQAQNDARTISGASSTVWAEREQTGQQIDQSGQNGAE
ncbi:hypothetical protein GCM10027404_07630 [Arthrobacter tumbae]|uniref:HNH endonuclease n=1 Tax=Arthrobacter tumbae TaxID=163874 RepID=UPI00195C1E6B|nr:HNH endonuclease [Arthrobacter tumbae]MBM7782048.1 5-methylcytosine-specific restriction protein A [Arthrobacter tumbae]